MKLNLVILLICLLVKNSTAQNIFGYEQKIELSEDYKKLEIKFTNPENGIEFSGTLIQPNKEFNKIVMIVPGSGKDTRHSHFDVAKELLLNQIAVYRFDERGIGKSGGRYNRKKETATSLEKDVISAFKKLKSLDGLSNKKIGILGHSLGGIASIGALGKGCDFDFLIQMATPVENNGAFLKYQVTTNIGGFYTVKGKSPNEVIHFIDAVRKAIQADENYKASRKKAKITIKQLNFFKGRHIINPVMIDLMKQNHEETYKTSRVPILFIIGSKDRIVNGKDEIRILKKLNNPNITISLINNADHYLNDKGELRKKGISPYNMTSTALRDIINWTLELK